MSSCVCKISFKSVQVCGGCCKMFRGLTFFGTQCSYTVCQSDYIMHIMLMQAAKEFLTLKLAKQTAITIMQEAVAQKNTTRGNNKSSKCKNLRHFAAVLFRSNVFLLPNSNPTKQFIGSLIQGPSGYRSQEIHFYSHIWTHSFERHQNCGK